MIGKKDTTIEEPKTKLQIWLMKRAETTIILNIDASLPGIT